MEEPVKELSFRQALVTFAANKSFTGDTIRGLNDSFILATDPYSDRVRMPYEDAKKFFSPDGEAFKTVLEQIRCEIAHLRRTIARLEEQVKELGGEL